MSFYFLTSESSNY